ncbi:MAG: hypothetical protein ACXV7G_09340 [Halobacteriota archaeon]
MINRPMHVGDVKVGSVKGHSRVYPQLRLPSLYVGLAGGKASIYVSDETDESITFVIHVVDRTGLSYGGGRSEATREHSDRACGDHDAMHDFVN